MIKYDKILSIEPLLGEDWLDVVGWEDLYAISNFGRVKSKQRQCLHYAGGILVRKEKILKQNNCRGYLTVLLYRGETDKFRTGVHRLLATAFIDNPENKPTVNHKDTIKHHNVLSNLEWATDQEQQNHAVKMGLRDKTLGDNCNFSKLNSSDILAIRNLYDTGKYFHREIADMFGVSQMQVFRIINKKAWKHI